jgi:IclR family transcriptional regulator, acetate operon repressor
VSHAVAQEVQQAARAPAIPQSGETRRRNDSTSVRRTLRLLQEIAKYQGHREGPTLAECAALLGLNKSTVLRLLSPLCDAGLVRRSGDSRRYWLGPETVCLGQAYLGRLSVRAIAHTELVELSERSQQTANLTVYDSGDIVYVDQVPGRGPLQVTAKVGSRMLACSTASGRAMLAHATNDTVEEAILCAGKSPTVGERRRKALWRDPERFRKELIAVHVAGVAVDDEDNEPGIRCIGAAIIDREGNSVAALSIAGAVTEVTTESLAELGELVRLAAARVSELLGAPRT